MFHIGVLSVSSIILIFLGIVIWVKDPKNKANQYFLLTIFNIIVWILSNYFADLHFFNPTALFWNRFAFSAGMLISFTLLCFVWIFPKVVKEVHWLVKFAVVFPTFLFAVMSIASGSIIKDVTVESWGTNAILGRFYNISLIWIFIAILIIFWVLFYKIKKLDGILRVQTIYLTIGFFLYTLVTIILSTVFPAVTHSTEFSKYSPYGIIFFVGFTAYAILKHHLFNIRVILTETAVVIISLVLLIQVFLSKTLVERIIRTIFFLIVLYGGYLLIKSVIEEIRRRQEIQRLSEQLKKANIRLKELDRMKSEFLSVASHELNSPMSVIKGYLHMILYEGFGKVDKTAKQFLERVYMKTDQLAKLVSDLLNVSRIEQGRVKLQIQPCDIQTSLRTLVEDYSMSAKEKNLTVALYEPKTKIPYVNADPDKLKEIISNLLSNSLKYTKQGGVDVSIEQINNEVKVAIKDTGMGIPKQAQSHIFEKFYRVDNSLVRETGGTGLGLYIIKGYLELMNGKVWFESEGENKGTTFYFTLSVVKKGEKIKKEVKELSFQDMKKPDLTKNKEIVK